MVSSYNYKLADTSINTVTSNMDIHIIGNPSVAEDAAEFGGWGSVPAVAAYILERKPLPITENISRYRAYLGGGFEGTALVIDGKDIYLVVEVI
jgi:hypothetical protein